MKYQQRIKFISKKGGELLPADFTPDFPYTVSRIETASSGEFRDAWIWHKAAVFFYIEQGVLELAAPDGRRLFPAGSGGFINSDVVYYYDTHPDAGYTVWLQHLFDVSFLSGQYGGRIEQKYIVPLQTASHVKILGLYPEHQEQALLLEALRCSFRLSAADFSYEIHLRAALSEIWCGLLQIADLKRDKKQFSAHIDCKIKQMLRYIRENYAEKISVFEIAAAAQVSERDCFRIFRDCLRTTPMTYLKEYRLQNACRMLSETNLPPVEIGAVCGLGRNSSFKTTFYKAMACTPAEYRRIWQKRDIRYRSFAEEA